MKRLADWSKAAACDGKKTFDTYRDAEKIADRPSKAGYARRPYHCPACHKYHIGTPKPKHSRPRRPVFILDDLEGA